MHGVLRFAQDDKAFLRHNSFLNKEEEGDQREQERDLVELRRMARDAVAEVDGPGEIGRSAVGVVGEASEKAADASDGDAECKWDGVEISGGLVKSYVAFDEFDG